MIYQVLATVVLVTFVGSVLAMDSDRVGRVLIGTALVAAVLFLLLLIWGVKP